MEYAVVDLETTGIYPAGHDRIIEVGIVRLDEDLRPQEEFSTLTNPERDIGPTWLHGIRAGDVLEAPTFDEVAGLISEFLDGALLVGHNVNFDIRFLQAEYARSGHELSAPSHLDTMALAVRAGADSRRLQEACDLFSIQIQEQHAALGDARATADLLACCVSHLGRDHVQSFMREGAREFSWPHMENTAQPVPRSEVTRSSNEDGFLTRLVTELPASSQIDGDWQEYFAVLDRALEDRRLSADEKQALRDAVLNSRLSQSDLTQANNTYLESVIQVALADGAISDSEWMDLEEVARLLGLSDELDQMIEVALTRRADRPAEAPQSHDIPLQGRTVCFTGALNGVVDGERATREMASRIAETHGMIVKKSVTKKLDYLVLADPDSMSGKAEKARSYGIRMLAEPVFWSAVGVQTE